MAREPAIRAFGTHAIDPTATGAQAPILATNADVNLLSPDNNLPRPIEQPGERREPFLQPLAIERR